MGLHRPLEILALPYEIQAHHSDEIFQMNYCSSLVPSRVLKNEKTVIVAQHPFNNYGSLMKWYLFHTGCAWWKTSTLPYVIQRWVEQHESFTKISENYLRHSNKHVYRNTWLDISESCPIPSLDKGHVYYRRRLSALSTVYECPPHFFPFVKLQNRLTLHTWTLQAQFMHFLLHQTNCWNIILTEFSRNGRGAFLKA